MFTTVLNSADDLLLRLHDREDELRPHAASLIPAVETICHTLHLISLAYPLRALLSAIDPPRRDVMATCFLDLDRQATAVILDAHEDNTADVKAGHICALAVSAVFALVSMRPLLEQLVDNTPLNRHLVGELAGSLSLLSAFVGP